MAMATAMTDIDFLLSLAGWLVFAGYLITAFFSALAVRAIARSAGPSIGVRGWSLMVVFLLAMGFNKQLDLHQGIWNWTRQVAKAQNWAEHRQTVHLVFVGSVGLLGVAVLAGLRHVLADAWRHHRPALFGLLMLLSAVVLRLMTLRAFEKWYGWRLHWHLNWAVESCGLVLIVWGALRCLRGEDGLVPGNTDFAPVSGQTREGVGLPD